MRIHEFRWRRQSSSVSWRSRPFARHSSMKPAKSSPSFVSVTPWFFIRAWRQGSERNSSAVSASTLPYCVPPFPELSRTCAPPPPSSSVSSFLFFFSSFSLVLSLSSFLRFVSSLRLRGGVPSPVGTGGRAAAACGVWGASVLPSPLRGCAQSVSLITLSPSVSAPSETQKRP